LWIAPFLAALSITDWAVCSFSAATSTLPSAEAERTSLMTFLVRVLNDLLRNRRISFWRERFSADLWLANFKNSFPYQFLIKQILIIKECGLVKKFCDMVRLQRVGFF
jgi:hypothetical protein